VRLFNDALRKHANHARVIFIDINWPSAAGRQFPTYLVQAFLLHTNISPIPPLGRSHRQSLDTMIVV